MTRRHAADEATTYLLESSEQAIVIDLVQALTDRGVQVPSHPPALVDADGRKLDLPQPVFDALLQIVTALSEGQGVTVAPHNALLTTQEAADFLGISRPTLVRLIEVGEVAHERRGRHRRVRLSELVDYQRRSRGERRRVLAHLVEEAEDAGLYEATAGPPPDMR
jgi:excisionase family DNA binding protein